MLVMLAFAHLSRPGSVPMKDKPEFTIFIESFYSMDGTPTDVEVWTKLDIDGKIYYRFTMAGSTLIEHLDLRSGVQKEGLESGEKVLVHKFPRSKSKEDYSKPKGKAEKQNVQRISGIDCFPISDIHGSDEAVWWVKVKDPTKGVALMTYDSGRITCSMMFVEDRVGLRSDIKKFDFRPGAIEVTVGEQTYNKLAYQFILDPPIYAHPEPSKMK